MTDEAALPAGAWKHTCMAPGDEASCVGCRGARRSDENARACNHPGLDHAEPWSYCWPCPACGVCKFIGHGPLCGDCAFSPGPVQP